MSEFMPPSGPTLRYGRSLQRTLTTTSYGAWDQSAFKVQLSQLLNRIETVHGEVAIIHVFPELPNTAAVEVGRVWMPESDLPMVVCDQNRSAGGFIRPIEIES